MANDFLVFGGAGSANVIDQSTYAGMSTRQTGFKSGVAQSAQLNKVWRQSSIMAAAVAEFVEHSTGADMIDDGTLPTIVDNLKAGISASSPGLAGSARNLTVRVPAVSQSAMLWADQLIVQSADGLTYELRSFTQTVNIGLSGIGGMDVGRAPVTGHVGIYVIYDPTTGNRALLAVDASNAVLSELYAGANMPDGYTASALVSVWRVQNSMLQVGVQNGRKVSHVPLGVLSSSSIQPGLAALYMGNAVSKTVKRLHLYLATINTLAVTNQVINVACDAAGSGLQGIVGNTTIANNGSISNAVVDIGSAPQTIFYQTANNPSGVPTFSIVLTGYEF